MAKRSCRRTTDENLIHKKAVELRKKTDEQLVHYVEDRVEKPEVKATTEARLWQKIQQRNLSYCSSRIKSRESEL